MTTEEIRNQFAEFCKEYETENTYVNNNKSFVIGNIDIFVSSFDGLIINGKNLYMEIPVSEVEFLHWSKKEIQNISHIRIDMWSGSCLCLGEDCE